VKKVKYYFRYADDIVILHSSKEYLHGLLAEMREYLTTKLKLVIKDNYQVFVVAVRGIDFLGYVFFHTHVLLRKTIKKRFARMMKKRRNGRSFSAYNGWLTHCNGRHLMKKILYS
jgi:hypothetical protein